VEKHNIRVKEDEMGSAYCMSGRDEEHNWRIRWDNNIEEDIKEMLYELEDWINLAQNRIH
jgi:hypothetical protein